MWLPHTCPATREPGLQPSMSPDWESNWPPFGSQAGAQSTEPHQPGLQAVLNKSITLSGVQPRKAICSNAREKQAVLNISDQSVLYFMGSLKDLQGQIWCQGTDSESGSTVSCNPTVFPAKPYNHHSTLLGPSSCSLKSCVLSYLNSASQLHEAHAGIRMN